MASTPDLVCVGHVIREMIHFPDAVRGPFLGSPPAYCAVAAARQGTATGVVTRIGPDMPPDLLRPLVEAGVDTAGVVTGRVTTSAELIYDAQGTKEIRYPTKAEPITVADVPTSYRGCRLVYVCPMDNDVRLADLAGVVALGQSSAADLGGYGGVHMSRENRRAVASLSGLACRAAAHFQVVKASDEDAAIMFGRDDPEESGRVLLASGPQVVLITLGPRGVLVCTQEGTARVLARPSRVVDMTGGGDTFMAGFLSEYLRSGDPVRAAQWGCATAACAIERTGGVSLERMPTRQEIEDRLGV